MNTARLKVKINNPVKKPRTCLGDLDRCSTFRLDLEDDKFQDSYDPGHVWMVMGDGKSASGRTYLKNMCHDQIYVFNLCTGGMSLRKEGTFVIPMESCLQARDLI